MHTISFRNKTDIFFDLDHTLWDFEKNSDLAFTEVIEQMDLPFSVGDFLEVYRPINVAYWDKFSLNLITSEELRKGRIADTLSILNYVTTTQQILSIGERYLEVLPNFNNLLEGAQELLEYLSKRYTLHIITNGFEVVQNRKLAHSGIAGYFKTITNSENAGVKKPDPRIFSFALNVAKANVAQTVMVGDNWLADIQGAKNIGMDAIYYNESPEKVDINIAHVKRLIDIKNLL